MTIFFCNTFALLFQLSVHYVFPNCSICNNGYIIGRLLFVTIRCLNRLFFIQRAKLSQEIKPILSVKYFNKILPLTVLFLYSMFIIGIISINITDTINHYKKYECIKTEYITKYQCLQDTNDNNIDIVYIGSTLVAFITNIVIAFLFLKPMYLIPTIPNSVFSNCKQTRKQYKTVLIYNVVLSMINLLSSQFMVSIWSLYPETFWYMPSIDNMINALTTYLMIGRNRQWTVKIYYYIIEKLCCKYFIFSHQDTNIIRLSKDTNGTSQSTIDGIEYPIEMVHGDINKIRTYGSSITPHMHAAQKKQRLSTFVSEIELKWISEDELYRERQRTSGTNGHHQYIASDSANLAQYNLTTHIRKLQTVETAETDNGLISSYTETQKDIVTNDDMDEDESEYHNNLKAIKARLSVNIIENENDDAGSYDDCVMITKLLTMEEDDDDIDI
eukprot:134600_1